MPGGDRAALHQLPIAAALTSVSATDQESSKGLKAQTGVRFAGVPGLISEARTPPLRTLPTPFSPLRKEQVGRCQVRAIDRDDFSLPAVLLCSCQALASWSLGTKDVADGIETGGNQQAGFARPGKLGVTSLAKGADVPASEGDHQPLQCRPVEPDASQRACPVRRRLVGVKTRPPNGNNPGVRSDGSSFAL